MDDAQKVLSALQDRWWKATLVPPACPDATCAGGGVRRHAWCKRWVHVVIDAIVHRVECRLLRWKCRCCGRTFRQYPPGILPRLRYLLVEVRERIERLLPPASRSYSQAASGAYYEAPVAQAESGEAEKEREAGRGLAASTVWRWVGCLAGLREHLASRLKGWLAGEERVSGRSWSVPACRSEARRQVWSGCLLALRVLGENTTMSAIGGPAM